MKYRTYHDDETYTFGREGGLLNIYDHEEETHTVVEVVMPTFPHAPAHVREAWNSLLRMYEGQSQEFSLLDDDGDYLSLRRSRQGIYILRAKDDVVEEYSMYVLPEEGFKAFAVDWLHEWAIEEESYHVRT